MLVSILTALTEHTSDVNPAGTVIRGREGTATYGSVVVEAQRLDPVPTRVSAEQKAHIGQKWGWRAINFKACPH